MKKHVLRPFLRFSSHRHFSSKVFINIHQPCLRTYKIPQYKRTRDKISSMVWYRYEKYKFRFLYGILSWFVASSFFYYRINDHKPLKNFLNGLYVLFEEFLHDKQDNPELFQFIERMKQSDAPVRVLLNSPSLLSNRKSCTVLMEYGPYKMICIGTRSFYESNFELVGFVLYQVHSSNDRIEILSDWQDFKLVEKVKLMKPVSVSDLKLLKTHWSASSTWSIVETTLSKDQLALWRENPYIRKSLDIMNVTM
mmetsp:Transcript_1066/g.1655  ORF Transcript_1066/g.1655 Transcript_1066/m.1655 type:complete len:252 (+) Transcript_1066:15-770(+)